MAYRSVGVKQIFARVYRDFKPSNSGWINDAIEWVGDALDIMRIGSGFVQKSVSINVIDNKALIPCDIEMLLGVEYMGMRLPKSAGVNTLNRPCTCLDNLVCHPEFGYTMNPKYFHLPFQTGCITVHYLGVPVDCDGFPEVPDETKCKEAITWYIMMKMLGRGFKHQVFSYADCEARWLKMYPQAQNANVLVDIDDLELFKKSYLGIAKNTNLTNQFFNLDQFDPNGGSNAQVFLPGTKFENPFSTVTPEP